MSGVHLLTGSLSMMHAIPSAIGIPDPSGARCWGDGSTGAVLGMVERSRAYSTVHEGAIYLHLGESFLVRELNLNTLYAVVEAVARYFPATDSAQPRCLALGDDRIDPPSTLFASLRARGVDLMPPSRCPRSYASMIATVDARGRPINSAPPGHIEPQRIAIRELRPWAEDVITMSASTSVGLGSTSGQCAAVLEAVNKWVVGCSSLRHTVH